MTVPRLFVDAPLAPGVRLDLPDAQARYLAGVLRQEAGAPVLVFNGRDGEWRCQIETVARRAVTLEVRELSRPHYTPPDLHVLFSPVKRHGTNLIVEKATELGARVLRPVRARRTVAESVRTDRLRLIAIEAAEQTERVDIPAIREVEDLFRALDGWDQERLLLFADEGGDAPALASAVREVAPDAPLALLTGPEGGFDPREREALRALPFVRPVSLGPRILRAETAVIAALAVIQSGWGDWRSS